MTTETFDTSTTWLCPAGVFSVQAEAVGGGAGGNGRAAPAVSFIGGAGGGGPAYAKTNAVPVVPGNTYTITVGAAGTAGAAGDNKGLSGGDSWFSNTGVAPTSTAEGCLAKGGVGPATIAAGGVGGAAASCIGDTKTSGQNGGNAGLGVPGGKGGDGAAPLGGPGGAATTTQPQAGNPGTAPGGAGGGACATPGNARAGGPGAAGRVVLTYTLPATNPGRGFLGLLGL